MVAYGKSAQKSLVGSKPGSTARTCFPFSSIQLTSFAGSCSRTFGVMPCLLKLASRSCHQQHFALAVHPEDLVASDFGSLTVKEVRPMYKSAETIEVPAHLERCTNMNGMVFVYFSRGDGT